MTRPRVLPTACCLSGVVLATAVFSSTLPTLLQVMAGAALGMMLIASVRALALDARAYRGVGLALLGATALAAASAFLAREDALASVALRVGVLAWSAFQWAYQMPVVALGPMTQTLEYGE